MPRFIEVLLRRSLKIKLTRKCGVIYKVYCVVCNRDIPNYFMGRPPCALFCALRFFVRDTGTKFMKISILVVFKREQGLDPAKSLYRSYR